MTRAATIAPFGIAAALALAGCGSDPAPPDRDAVAAAKCTAPVSDALHLEDRPGQLTQVRVEPLGSGRYRVTGVARFGREDTSEDDVPYVCEVAPDSSDSLRGFKVTKLELDGVVQ